MCVNLCQYVCHSLCPRIGGWYLRCAADGSYQKPITALVTSTSGTTLTWRELRTFIHEMGHAIHAMVSNTHYQHLWGPRCPQDIVEIPSHLWEHFVTDYRSLSLLARHVDSREAMPEEIHAALVADHTLFPALELQQQVRAGLHWTASQLRNKNVRRRTAEGIT